MLVRGNITAGTVLNRYDFQGAILRERPQKAKIREQSVINVLNYFKAVRPNMSHTTIKETLRYLNDDSWVDFVTQPGFHEVLRNVNGVGVPNSLALYYPELIIIHATFPNDTRVHQLIDVCSKHWGFEFSLDGPSYPSGLDADTEYCLFRGGYLDNQSQKIKRENSTASETKDNVSQNKMLDSAVPKETKNLSDKARVVETEASTGNKAMDAFDASAVTSKEPYELLSPKSGYQVDDERNEDAVIDHDERVRNLEAQLEQAKKDRDQHRAERAAYHRQKANAFKRIFDFHEKKAQEYSTGADEQSPTSGGKSSQLYHERPEKRQRQT
ncbi:hypothetical protein FSARC_3482 [Fusarium sarcochroum]|uniref:Uncharacterized protein n=1 Tax=Fusarium sarcochroum TaxID=1208366 RepID=A0A8H4XCK4_9HYPO|nr:hypothetical protein FSARC_3482 [Fusarium sarcochroum]